MAMKSDEIHFDIDRVQPRITPRVAPDHLDPAWLRGRAAYSASSVPPDCGCRDCRDEQQTAAALSRLADILDVCGREDVCIDPPDVASGPWIIYRHADSTGVPVHVHGPTLPAAVRAFLAAEQEATKP